MRDRLLLELDSNSWWRLSFDATGVYVQNEVVGNCLLAWT